MSNFQTIQNRLEENNKRGKHQGVHSLCWTNHNNSQLPSWDISFVFLDRNRTIYRT